MVKASSTHPRILATVLFMVRELLIYLGITKQLAVFSALVRATFPINHPTKFSNAGIAFNNTGITFN
mgnify:CR=1 FL=1